MGLESNVPSTAAESNVQGSNVAVFLDVCKNRESSQSLGKIFLEDERGFRAVDNTDLSSSAKSLKDKSAQSETVAFIDKCWKVVSNYCYGLLAGIALWQWVLICQLSPPQFEISDFASHYSYLTRPFELLINLLCTVTVVSSFDRFHLYSSDGNFLFKMLLTSKTRTCMAILYPLALVISLSISHIDDIFDCYKVKAPYYNSTEMSAFYEDITHWRSMNTARCLIVVLGWIAVVLQQDL